MTNIGTSKGKEIETMNRDELLEVITYLSREVTLLNKKAEKYYDLDLRREALFLLN